MASTYCLLYIVIKLSPRYQKTKKQVYRNIIAATFQYAGMESKQRKQEKKPVNFRFIWPSRAAAYVYFMIMQKTHADSRKTRKFLKKEITQNVRMLFDIWTTLVRLVNTNLNIFLYVGKMATKPHSFSIRFTSGKVTATVPEKIQQVVILVPFSIGSLSMPKNILRSGQSQVQNCSYNFVVIFCREREIIGFCIVNVYHLVMMAHML